MFIIANDLRRSNFIIDLNHGLNLLMAEKLHSRSAKLTGTVKPIFIKVKTFGNFNLSQCLIAFARLAGQFSFPTSLHLLFQNFSSK